MWFKQSPTHQRVYEVTGPVPGFPCAEPGDHIVFVPGCAPRLVRVLTRDQLHALTSCPSALRPLSSCAEPAADGTLPHSPGPPAPTLRLV